MWTKESKVPEECYNRISGALFSDAGLKVTTNKLTFIDLEIKLNCKDTIYTHVSNGKVTCHNDMHALAHTEKEEKTEVFIPFLLILPETKGQHWETVHTVATRMQ